MFFIKTYQTVGVSNENQNYFQIWLYKIYIWEYTEFQCCEWMLLINIVIINRQEFESDLISAFMSSGIPASIRHTFLV